MQTNSNSLKILERNNMDIGTELHHMKSIQPMWLKNNSVNVILEKGGSWVIRGGFTK